MATNYKVEVTGLRQLFDALDKVDKKAADLIRKQITKAGGKVTRAPGPVKFGTTVIAFVEDPDGYKIELIERKEG